MRVFAPYLASLLDYAEYHNLDSTTLLDILPEHNIDLCDPNEMIEAKTYLSVFEKAIEVTNSDYFGLNFGSYLNLGALGLVLEISLNTSSIEQGVYILQQFLKTKFPLVTATVIKDQNHFILQLESSVKHKKMRRHLLDLVLAIVFRELKLMIPKHFTPQIRIPFLEKKCYTDVLKTKIAYGDNYQLVLPLDIIKTEINKSKIKEIELLLPQFLAMLNKDSESKNRLSSQIRHMTLRMCAPEIPNFEQVQKQFPFSKRTIQRKLTNEGTSFRRILNDIKKELSQYLVNEKHLKTKDVAYILGYSESSAYLHAVKSWRKN
ncbi:AraC family transcriptional regulator ligand-binding domain-containing protein [Psychroserpens luteolus]|uniref:AraC family transcriptional regulator ligand-binding domain-containing protein n=1 Tax=Psychroserpens luteolus TaxID=2855840 RepID=UPI001E57A967|nr:AraC family transcriptional regulator ligand-binding domain-containing protein [Psychroserpens luteolus]MCD2260392.1 AraC family transcriptional regulator ligand-binding domain-containing protein [Psychroserpens luteolus]